MKDRQVFCHRVNNTDDLEPVYPIHVVGYSGFFYFPDDSDIAVSIDGKILNLRNNKLLKSKPNIFNKCYVHFSKSNDKTKSYQVHRILAITFIGRPSRHLDKSFVDLEVNHIDGFRCNNELINLEWVTGEENVLHSHLSGFNTRDKPVIAKHAVTGIEKYFHSGKNCADAFGIHRATFWKHLENGNSGKFHKSLFVFKYDDETSWDTNEISELKELGKSNLFKSVLLENLIDNSKIIFSSIKEASVYVKIPHVTLWRKIKRDNVVTIGNYKFSLR